MRRPDSTSPPRPTVLIVDDNADKLLALESILLTIDVEIVTAHSGREALRRLLERDFAVILLDVRMPGMDGFETATLIRQRQRSANTPIIFITAFSEEMHVAKGYSLRAVDYIMAPVVPDVLRTKVSVLVELYRATAEVSRQAERLRRRAAQLHQLTQASLAINSADSIDAMVAIATTSAVELVDADLAATVADVDDRRVSHVSGPARATSTPEPMDSPVGPEVRRTNGIVRLVWERDDGKRRHGLGVPLMGRDGGNLGSIDVARTDDAGFDPEDEHLLVQLAQMTCIAIENVLASEAREANRLKDEFIAAVSHELRTPLNALRSWAWVLRHHAADPEKLATIAQAIERSVGAQARIVDDLLDVSRIMTGKMSLRLEPLDVRSVVETALDGMAVAAAAQGVELVRRVPAAATLVAGDADRLAQIVSNLVSNAVKFSEQGGRVDVTLDAEGDTLVLRVADTGCGIAAHFLPHVFDRFRQADGSATRRAGGLGVGLTIVRQLVEMHGGSVVAHSDGEGRGATFTVRLPLLRDEPTRAHEEGAEGGLALLDGVRVLLVEDDADTRQVMEIVLAGAGAVVVSAGSAEEGMAHLAADRFHAIVCDIGLPGEDGYAFIRRARGAIEWAGCLPALAVSAFARKRDTQRAREAGFDGHLAKPVDPDTLLHALRTLLAPGAERSHAVRALRGADARIG